MDSIFRYHDYKEYLRGWLDMRGKGERSRLAKAMRCQPSYLSQVLNQNADLSSEQAARVARFANFGSLEGRYFRLLAEYARATVKELKDQLRDELSDCRAQARELAARLDYGTNLGPAEHAFYYASWVPAAVHMLTSSSGGIARADIARRLGVAANVVDETLSFLARIGYVRETGAKFVALVSHMHIDRDSPFAMHQHFNLRMRGLQQLETGGGARRRPLFRLGNA